MKIARRVYAATGRLRHAQMRVAMSVAKRLRPSDTGVRTAASAMSSFTNVPMGPPDPIFGITDAFNKDTSPNKVSLGVGAYRDDKGKPYVLQAVREAEKKILEGKLNHEYAGIEGVKEYVKVALEFAYGRDCAALQDGRIVGVQTISGTGACRLAGEFFARFIGQGTHLYLPTPTWGNHIPIFKDAGLEVKRYRYYDPNTNGLDFDGLREDISNAPTGSAFLLHACAHNPTGVDPTVEQWKELSALFKEKGHALLFDAAYLGFASGNVDRDAGAVRQFVSDGHSFLMAQSFAKNFGLYGERVGTLSAVCASKEEADRVMSQLKILIRPMYSNPPVYGARIVSTVLHDKELTDLFYKECKGMADRIITMRQTLRDALEKDLGSKRCWKHVTDQIGMFAFSGLTPEEVKTLRDKHHIYMTGDGRISIAGLNSSNVRYVAESIHAVTSD